VNKSTDNPYRGLKKRAERKIKHNRRADFERILFEMRLSKVINIYVKDINDNHTPTDFYVVAFNLKESMTFKQFEETLLSNLRCLI